MKKLRKLGSLLLATLLIFGTSLTAFATDSATGTVTGIDSGVFISSIDYSSGDSFTVGPKLGDIYEDFTPGGVINIYLDPSKFVGGGFTPETGMPASALERAGVSFRIVGGTNSNLVQNVSYKEKTLNSKRVAMIQIKLVDQLVSTDTKDFDTTLTLYANKVKQQSINVSGSIGSKTVPVDNADGYIFLGEGVIAEATENITGIEVDAGQDVILTARMIKGKKYYAVAKLTPTSHDMEVMAKHAAIQLVYQLDTTGFSASDVTVKIKSSEVLHTYDEKGNYLGTTADALALASKYYLATEKVDMKLDGEPITSPVDGDSDTQEPGLPPVDGTDEGPTPGDNGTGVGGAGSGGMIPDTGIGTMPKLALFALVAGLGILAIVTRKAKK